MEYYAKVMKISYSRNWQRGTGNAERTAYKTDTLFVLSQLARSIICDR